MLKMQEGNKRLEIEWRCGAVVHEDSHEFAKELERQLNLATKDGFSLAQMIMRETDKGLVLVHQRAIADMVGPFVPMTQAGDELQ